MKDDHEHNERPAKRVREPARVCLDAPDQERHPALQIIGIAGVDQGAECDFDVARDHDRYLAGLEDRRLSSES